MVALTHTGQIRREKCVNCGKDWAENGAYCGKCYRLLKRTDNCRKIDAFLESLRGRKFEGKIMGQKELLEYLEKHGESSIKELSEGLDVTKSTIGTLLKRLRRQDLVEKDTRKVGSFWYSFWRLKERKK